MNNYILGRKNIVLNFSKNYCTTASELLSSEAFSRVFALFLKKIKEKGNQELLDLINISKNPEEDFVSIFKLLSIFKIDEIKRINPLYNSILCKQESLYEMAEDLYEFWRSIERYSVIDSTASQKSMVNLNFIDANQTFTELVLKTYRNISEKLYGRTFHVYRQLPSGINAGMLVSENNWMTNSDYSNLKGVMFLDRIVIRPPFIVYSEKNTRNGVFKEVEYNPIEKLKLDLSEWYCYPAYVGESLAYVYFHQDYISHGITLCNLFEFVHLSECKEKKPDLIYVFGYKQDGECVYHHDKNNDIYTAIAPHGPDIDYFGYMKKMLLTLNNTRMLDKGYLPIHGACVNLSFKNGNNKTLVIIGDSGAGKSESLEALRTFAADDIVNMSIIFDDMGILKIENNKVIAYGTEIGAFVRLDDLENGYAYKEMDRAIFMNPDKINSRVVIPVNTYRNILKGFEVDMVLYANNYEDNNALSFFNKEQLPKILEVFRNGARVAKGTTNELGLVTSYFANPFGLVQRTEQAEVLLQKYFSKMVNDNIKVGEIYTKLAISGKEHSGPKDVAKALSKLLNDK
ncbi:MAG: phosphoenolpyruvate carboxykinase [Anaeroplasmataceae bacterium]